MTASELTVPIFAVSGQSFESVVLELEKAWRKALLVKLPRPEQSILADRTKLLVYCASQYFLYRTRKFLLELRVF